MYKKLYSQITDSLVREGYVVIENALSSALSASLLSFARDEKGFRDAGISSGSYLDKNRRGDKILWMDEDGEAQSKFLDFANGLKEHLNRELYIGISYYESHFAIYDRGDFYEKHLDSFKGSKNRVVTTVYYLNEEWSRNDGGELIVYDMDGKKLKEVTPKADTLVVFLSDRFPHEVLQSERKRYSIAGWFRIDKI